MGIKKLKQVIENLCNEKGVFIYNDFSDFVDVYKKEKYSEIIGRQTSEYRRKNTLNSINNSFLKVAVDVSLFGHKYKRNFDSIEYGFLKQILSCLSSKIIPIYVFDGKNPCEKQSTITKRINNRRNNKDKLDAILCYTNNTIQEYSNFLKGLEPLIQIFKEINPFDNIDSLYTTLVSGSSLPDKQNLYTTALSSLQKKSIFVDFNDINKLKIFFNQLGIPFIVASGEADSMIAKLSQLNYIDACLSDDSDMLPKGCKNVIHIKNNKIYRYDLCTILNTLEISYNLFIDYCILLGNDYYRSSKNVDPYLILSYVKSNLSISDILKNIFNSDQDTIDYCINLRTLFTTSNEKVDIKFNQIDYKTLDPKIILDCLKNNNIKLDFKALEKIKNKIWFINKMLKES